MPLASCMTAFVPNDNQMKHSQEYRKLHTDLRMSDHKMKIRIATVLLDGGNRLPQ